VLLLALRAHDYSEGTQISFGHLEVEDLDAWYKFISVQPNVDPHRIGMLGTSMGGAIAIQYAANHPTIRILVADCAFSSMDDTIETSVKHFTGLPPFPFASLIGFWIRDLTGLTKEEADSKKAIAKIAPRAVFLMQGGADTIISADSGQKLYDAAGQPKFLWYDPALGHAKFFDERRDEYEKRVIGFVDTYLH
jgi:dienelactone hydrolase